LRFSKLLLQTFQIYISDRIIRHCSRASTLTLTPHHDRSHRHYLWRKKEAVRKINRTREVLGEKVSEKSSARDMGFFVARPRGRKKSRKRAAGK
jgi:hypothetical protein